MAEQGATAVQVGSVLWRQITQEVVAPVRQEAGLGHHAHAEPGKLGHEFGRHQRGVLDAVAGPRAHVGENRQQKHQRLAGNAVHRDGPPRGMHGPDPLGQVVVPGQPRVGQHDLVWPGGGARPPLVAGQRSAEGRAEEVDA